MAVEYFFKAPADLAERLVIVVAPVLATANTAVAAIDRLKERGAKDIRFVCLLGAPQGFERLRGIHPDVPIWTAAIDDAPRRARLHPARPRRCRRPRIRHAVVPAQPHRYAAGGAPGPVPLPAWGESAPSTMPAITSAAPASRAGPMVSPR